MGGSTKVIETTPKSGQQARAGINDYLFGGQSGRASALRSGVEGQAAPQIGYTDIARADQVGGADRSSIRDVSGFPQVTVSPITGLPQVGSHSFDPSQFGGAPNVSGQQINPAIFGSAFGGGSARDVTAGPISGVNTQSVDQLGGANSEFFRNMIAQLQPAFAQQRALGLAGAKEASGTLTGSGYANTLGSAVNRSLGDEQARLADYATRGLETEVGRQTSLAGLEQGRAISEADQRLRAGIANQGADVNLMDMILRGNISGQDSLLRALLGNQATGLQASEANARNALLGGDQRLQALLGNQRTGLAADTANASNATAAAQANLDAALRAGLGNQDASIRAGIANQGADISVLDANTQRMIQNMLSSQGANTAQAQLNQGANIANQGAIGDMNNANAQRFLQLLLGMGTTGVGTEVVQRGGAGSILGPLAGIAGSFLGGPAGGVIANKIFG